MTELTGHQSMGELGRYFPSGFKAKTADDYLERLQREGFSDADVQEGVEREIATRTQRTFPPFASLRTKILEGRTANSRDNVGQSDNDHAAWLKDPRVQSGVCTCRHGIGMHGPAEGGYGEPMITGKCRMCGCRRYNAGLRVVS
jgi:hypothetical protein